MGIVRKPFFVCKEMYKYVESDVGQMYLAIFEIFLKGSTAPDALSDLNHGFWRTAKISDDYLTPLFERFFDEIGFSRNTMDKSKFYQLVDFSDVGELNEELLETINRIREHLVG